MRRRRFPFVLLVVLGAGCLSTLAGPDPSSSPRSLFDIIWQDFDRNYASFGIKNIDWDAVYTRYRPRADSASTAAQLVPIVGAMFAELRDPHVELATPSTVVTSIDWRTQHTYFSSSTVFNDYVPTRKLTPSRNMAYGTVAPGVGYVLIGTFSGRGWEDEIDDVLASFNSPSAVIVDVRNNGGGSSATSNAIAARFVDARRTYSFVRFRNGPAHDDFDDYIELVIEPAGNRFTGKVIVLTNRLAVSASEHFVLAMRSSPNVLILGDTTAGGLANPMVRELPNGWIYRIPQWIQYGPNKEIYEGIGLAPNVVVSMTAADSVAKRDVQLERAVSLARP